MSGRALYNEIEPAACAALRALVEDGVIAPGVVETRSIASLHPSDLLDFTQVHLFAGGGLWSVAARMAGWPDARPIWTASCPCQPFSAAGKGGGRDDPRHLWPHVLRLARACRPAVLVGEQVASAAGLAWFDGVAADLAGEGYACRAVDIPAAAVDAPHRRQRLYWVALADAVGERRGEQREPERAGIAGASRSVAERRDADGREQRTGALADGDRDGCDGRDAVAGADARERRNGSFWSDAEWLVCHDGKARRAQSGLRLLVDGFPGRVGLWRVAGNAIVPQLAAEVLGALMDALDEGGAP